jgi:uncharacterized membrane protein
MLQVIWALGWSMIVLAGLIWLPRPAIIALAVAVIVGHNLLDTLYPDSFGAFGGLWNILHQRGIVELAPGYQVFVLYPLVPWLGVMAAGYGLGPLFEQPPAVRRRLMLGLGTGMVAVFVVLRALNVYGDPVNWFPQKDALFTALSFINTEKYPPSLLFLLMTLGPALIALAVLERPSRLVLQAFSTFGQVPLLFYVVHLLAIHLLALGLALIRYGRADWMFGTAWLFHIDFPPDYGYGLPVVYLIWLVVVVALWPLCWRFGKLKRANPRWWMGYL